MINEVIISKLDNLIGDFNTPFSKYLLYSYNLPLNDCEEIINNIKRDIDEGIVDNVNVVSIVDDYFKQKIIDLEKSEKIEYLNNLLEGDFFNKYLKKYELSKEKIDVIYKKVSKDILEDNISDFEIKRNLRFYFLNSVKQVSYLNDLNRIIGRNYDTLTIKKAKKQYLILTDSDIVDIINNIKSRIIEAYDFKRTIKNEFLDECMKRSEAKKAYARLNLDDLVDGSGDSFFKLIEFKKISIQDGKAIVSQIKNDINNGLIQPNEINGMFLTKRFDEYIENEAK